MCVGNENKSISDSDLCNTLINSIMKLSKDKQKIVIEEAKRLVFLINKKECQAWRKDLKCVPMEMSVKF